MSRESTITLTHDLGAKVAKARLDERVDWALDHCRKAGFEVSPGEWEGNSLPFGVKAMGQAFDGRLDVTDRSVVLRLSLPFLLRLMLPMLEPVARSYGDRLFAKAA